LVLWEKSELPGAAITRFILSFSFFFALNLETFENFFRMVYTFFGIIIASGLMLNVKFAVRFEDYETY